MERLGNLQSDKNKKDKTFILSYCRPSFFGFVLQGLLIGIFIILFIKNYQYLNSKEIMGLTLLASIAIGIHSIIHYREEIDNNLNPICNFIKNI